MAFGNFPQLASRQKTRGRKPLARLLHTITHPIKGMRFSTRSAKLDRSHAALDYFLNKRRAQRKAAIHGANKKLSTENFLACG